jgi:CheY-like chemotaxis protein
LPIKILVIDDEPQVREMIYDYFSRRRYDVYSAEDGESGIRVCGQIQPDFIFLDLKMKYLDGPKAVRQLKKSTPAARIFLISGYGDDLSKVHAANPSDIACCFSKPVSLALLEQQVKDHWGALPT